MSKIARNMLFSNQENSMYFYDIIENFSKNNNVAILTDGYPLNDRCPTGKFKTIEDICREFKFKILQKNTRIIVLEKIYTTPYDLPDVSYEETVYSANIIRELSSAASPSSLNLSLSGLKSLRSYASQLNTSQLSEMKNGLPCRNLDQTIIEDIKNASRNVHIRTRGIHISNIILFKYTRTSLFFKNEHSDTIFEEKKLPTINKNIDVLPIKNNPSNTISNIDVDWTKRKITYSKKLKDFDFNDKNLLSKFDIPTDINIYCIGKQFTDDISILRSICLLKNWHFNKTITGNLRIQAYLKNPQVNYSEFFNLLRNCLPKTFINYMNTFKNKNFKAGSSPSSFIDKSIQEILQKECKNRILKFEKTTLKTNFQLLDDYLKGIISIYYISKVLDNGGEHIAREVPDYITNPTGGFLRYTVNKFKSGKTQIILWLSSVPSGSGKSCSLLIFPYEGNLPN
ncbi:hypothetical protein [Armatimonas sp.]|uniref:hypothetical protein n=1 Tax=Armatimonas sp. TaxID=1872638 RepID=UPI0037502BE3